MPQNTELAATTSERDQRDAEFYRRGWEAAVTAAERAVKHTAHSNSAREHNEGTADALDAVRRLHGEAKRANP